MTGNGVTTKTVQHVFARANGNVLCEYCSRRIYLNVAVTASDRAVGDHRVPRCRGGHHKAANIAVVCRACDVAKGPLTAEEYLAVRGDSKARKSKITAILRRLETRKIVPRPVALHQEVVGSPLNPIVHERACVTEDLAYPWRVHRAC
jgi:hypothetical protein